MPVKNEPNTLGDGLKWEEQNDYSRAKVTVLSGQVLVLLEVIAKILLAVPTTGTAGAGNTGNGTMGSVAGGLQTQIGAYVMTCTAGGGSGAVTTPATGTAGAGGTGNGTMTAVSAGAAAQAGTYTMTCIEAVANAGIFAVKGPDGGALPDATVAVAYVNAQLSFTINDGAADFIVGDTFTVLASAAAGNSGTFAVRAPDGSTLPDATVAVAYSNAHLNFTIADGATDYAAGDTFTVTVAAGSGKVVALDPAAVNGAAQAYGIMIAAVDATSADKAGVAIVREAMIAPANLVWPTGISAGDKATALAALAEAGIVAVETA